MYLNSAMKRVRYVLGRPEDAMPALQQHIRSLTPRGSLA